MPWRHRLHWPHPAWISTLTRSPISNSSTSGPSAATVPIYSWPGVKFLLKGRPPWMLAGDPRWMISRSVAQIATASMRTSTSARPGTGVGLSRRKSSSGPPSTQAFIWSGIGKFGGGLDAGGIVHGRVPCCCETLREIRCSRENRPDCCRSSCLIRSATGRQLVDFERIGIGAARRLGQPEQLRGQRRHRHRGRGVARDVDHRIEILQHGRDMAERRRMNALHHARHEQLQRDGIGKAAGQRFRQPPGIDPGIDREPRRFREHRHGAADDHLVAELCGLARADRAHMREPPRHRQHIGPHPLDVGGIAAGHHRKRAFLRALGAAGDRRIDPSHAVGGLEPRGDGARRVRMDRREVDDELAGAGRVREAVAAEHDVFDGSGVGDAHEDDAGGGGHVARTGGSLRAGLDQGGGLAGGPVPDRDVMARLEQAPRHRKAHHPEPEIAELFRISVRRSSAIPIPPVAAVSRPACRPYHSPVRVADERRAASDGLPDHLNHERLVASRLAELAGSGKVEWG